MKKLIVTVLLLSLLLCGCGGEAADASQAAPVDVQTLYTALEAFGMPEMLELDGTMQLNLYGIRSEDVKQTKVAVASDGLRADEIWLIEAVDEAAAETIKGLAEGRVRQKDAESITYSPEQNVIVKKSHIAREGNWVIFICSPEVDKMVTSVQAGLGQ